MKSGRRLFVRCGLLVLALVALLLSADVWLKKLIALGIETRTGARVEIGHLNSRWSTGELLLSNLQIADPHQPLRNLLQADRARIVLQRPEFLRRRLVIDEAHLSNVQLDTPRTTSGQLGAAAVSAAPELPWLPAAFQYRLEEYGTKFLDCVEVRQSVTPPAESSLSSVAAEIRRAIPEKFVAVLAQAQAVSSQLGRIAQLLTNPAGNPLREPERVRMIAAELPQIEQSAHTARDAAAQLESDFHKELERLEQAKRADLASSKCRVTVANLEPELLQRILVSPQQLAQVEEAVQWIRWLRAALPLDPTDFAPQPKTGVDVHYENAPIPDLTIRTLQFEGAALVDGRHRKMFGTLRNWTFPLALNPRPIELEMRLPGDTHLLLAAEIDRRHGACRDTIRITQPELQVAPQSLGTADVVQVAVGPSRQLVDVEMTIDGESVEGTVQFRHAATELSLAELHELAGGPEMMAWVNRELANVREFETRLKLTGTLDNLRIECECDLADTIASAAAKSTGLEIHHARTTYQDQVEADYVAAVRELKAAFASKHQELLAELRTDLSRLQQLQQTATQVDAGDSIRR